MPVDITEYTDLAASRHGTPVVAGQEPALRTQQVAIGGSPAQSEPFNDATRFIRVHADAACRIAFGSSPAAGATSQRIPNGGTEYFGVIPGHRMSVIATS